MRCYVWLYLGLISEVTSLVVLKKINLKINPNYGAGTAVIETLPSGLTTLHIDGNLTRVLNGKLLVKSGLYYMQGKVRKSLVRVPTINYCDMMRGHFMPMQLVQVLIDRVQQYGRMIVPCPLQPGNYYMKGFFIDETEVPMYRLVAENYIYMIEVVFSQEVSGKLVQVFELQGYGEFNKSNWPQ